MFLFLFNMFKVVKVIVNTVRNSIICAVNTAIASHKATLGILTPLA